MNREKAIKIFKRLKENAPNEMHLETVGTAQELFEMAIQALSQEPCDDAISRKDVINAIDKWISEYKPQHYLIQSIRDLPPVTHKSGKCKNCKYFEYDSVAKVDGVPLIVAHEICNKWGDGCKTNEDGYCFLFEPQESEDKEE